MNDFLKRAFEEQPTLSAIDALRRAARAVPDDPTRPAYHFLPPANWMNDPNGPIYHEGYYHVFYQHNPYSDSWGSIHWGHARSSDLVHWEHLPIALSPSVERGEACCYSGTSVIRADGTPVIFYTKVGPEGAAQPFEQWMAVGDRQLLEWEKIDQNPVLSRETHGGPPILDDWRDPFIFEHGGDTYMVLGAVIDSPPEERAAVLLYRARDERLLEWDYQSVVLSSPKYEREFLECPNFFRLGDKWLLFVSPYHPVEYYVGDFDPAEGQFTPERKGRVDHSIDFYASNAFLTPDGRRIVLGWIRGFRKGRGWNGCLSLPREVELSDDNALVQRPVRELEALRDTVFELEPISLQSEVYRVAEVRGKQLEIIVRIRSRSAGRFGIRVRMGENESGGVEIALESETLIVDGLKVCLPAGIEHQQVDFHLFLDNSVLELFACGGRVAVTRTIYPPEDAEDVALFCDGRVEVERFLAWQLKSAPVGGFPSLRG